MSNYCECERPSLTAMDRSFCHGCGRKLRSFCPSDATNCSASLELADNDAARITQPDYNDLWKAYVAGAKSGQKHPNADDYWLNRAADGYCKLVHATKDPEHFAAMGQSGQNARSDAPGASE